MKKWLMGLAMASALTAAGAPAGAETTIRLGWCAPVVSPAAAPFAVAQKFGWFGEGVRVQLQPLPGSIDCVKQVATGELFYSAPSIEPLAIVKPQGVKAKSFYLSYHENIYGIAVPVESPIKDYADLRGKLIGVTAMGSAGVVMARALLSNAGINPDTEARIIAVGEAGQAAAMVRNKQVDALSQFDAAYGLIENAGVKLRFLDKTSIIKFPSNGLLALEKTLVERREEAAALGRGNAMGTLFTINNPEAAVRILFEVFPQTKATGVDEAGAIKLGLAPLNALMHVFDPRGSTGVTRWGEASMQDYDAYVDFLLKWGVLKQKVPASELATNELVDEFNRFDPAMVIEKARTWKP